VCIATVAIVVYEVLLLSLLMFVRRRLS